MSDWLADFVEHTRYGEAPANVMYWVGVSTIAGALRRKVWLDEGSFDRTPNFYVLLIGPPGKLKKSTSINLGMRMLRRVAGINFGPDNTSWEKMIARMADSQEVFTIDGEQFACSNMTLALGEFGTFFDPGNKAMVEALTRLYDAPDIFEKETKTNGSDYIDRPWLNICACTTPKWMTNHFSTQFIDEGLASRFTYVYCTETGRVAHPKRKMRKANYDEEENRLVRELQAISELVGEFQMTEEAYNWSEAWYEKYRDFLDTDCMSGDVGLYSRGQAHLLNLAMVISASRKMFPTISVEELKEADRVLRENGLSIPEVFGNVGQGAVSKLAGQMIEWLGKHGKMTRKALYMRFYKTVGVKDFDAALNSAKAAGIVRESGDVRDPLLEVV